MTPLQQRIHRTLQPPMHGWCTPEKGIQLADLILEYKPKVAFEIGVFGGRSLFAMAMAMQVIGRVATGVDPWTKEPNIEHQVDMAQVNWWGSVDMEAIYRSFVQSVYDLSLFDACQWIRGKSDNVAPFVSDGVIDFFHLDSNHSEITSTRDVKTWMPKMAQKAIWVMDDTNWETQARAIEMIGEAGFKIKADYQRYAVFER